MRLRQVLATTGVSIFLFGCAASGPKFSELPAVKEGGATVIVYRPHRSVNSAAYPYVYVDGEKRERLLEKGYVSYELTPGEHTIALINPAMWDGKQEWKLTATGGQRHFYRVISVFNRFQVVGPFVSASKTVSIQPVQIESALEDLKDLNLSD